MAAIIHRIGGKLRRRFKIPGSLGALAEFYSPRGEWSIEPNGHRRRKRENENAGQDDP
jgi:hypothetical protein